MIVLENEIGNFIKCNNKTYSYFGGNNYLGLASHPAVKEAAIIATEKYGVSFSASRQTTGTSRLHLELEDELARFKGREDSVIFASGYMGNSILLDCLDGNYSAVFVDRLSHPSIIWGIPKNKVNVFMYDHCDTEDLERQLYKHRQYKSIIITDGIFPLTGDIAPIDIIYEHATKYHSLLIVDDAHSTGILGEKGRGTPEFFDLDNAPGIYQSETMSKALGSYGGFIAADRPFINKIRENSAIYQASTSLPPSVVAAGLASLRIIRKEPSIRKKVLELSKIMRKEISEIGFKTSGLNTPIIPLFMPSYEAASNLSGFLQEKGIIVPVVRYPGIEKTSLIRITVSANHKNVQIEELLENLKKWIKTWNNLS